MKDMDAIVVKHINRKNIEDKIMSNIFIALKKITSFRLFISDETGTSAIEYGLLAALVSVAIIGGSTSLGESIDDTFEKNATHISGNASNQPLALNIPPANSFAAPPIDYSSPAE